MSFSGYMGFITGLVVGCLVVAVRMLVMKRKGVIESDEMTGLIRRRTAESSFWILVGFAFVAWVVDNVLRHQAGSDVQFFSPWGIMLWTSVLIYLVALFYHNHMVSGNVLGGDKSKQMQAGMVMVASGTVISIVNARASTTFAPDIHPFLVTTQILFIIAGVSLVVTARYVKNN